jgi:hypothetical protein
LQADAKREKRTIAHALFTYEPEDGGQAIALRGATVDLLPADIERGEKHQAFTAKAGQMPTPSGSTLPEYPKTGTPAEQDNWVTSGTVEEILAAVNADPAIADSVTAAEGRRKDSARKTLLEALTVISNRSA